MNELIFLACGITLGLTLFLLSAFFFVEGFNNCVDGDRLKGSIRFLMAAIAFSAATLTALIVAHSAGIDCYSDAIVTIDRTEYVPLEDIEACYE